ncbi:MAG: hypothetical protein RL409_27 [Gemmatimonadota bacterium]|jgi:hypothetical protein
MTKHLTTLLAFVAGTAVAMSGAALVREAPGAKNYFVHQLAVSQAPLADGGSDVSAIAYTTVTLDLADGGTDVVDLGGVACPLTDARKATLRTILTASEACARNAP